MILALEKPGGYQGWLDKHGRIANAGSASELHHRNGATEMIARMKQAAILTSLLLVFHHDPISAQEYVVSRHADGPFAFKILGAIEMNEGSSLIRESIMLNDPSCPVQVTRNSTSITYESRAYAYKGSTEVSIRGADVRAVELRHVLFNVFGEHIKNLSNTEARDLASGEHVLTGTWRAFDHEINEFLTTATYVARVRLKDGTQWVFDRDRLLGALGNLNLEKQIDDE